MLTRDEIVQLILYLIVATVLLLVASRMRAETSESGSREISMPANGQNRHIADSRQRPRPSGSTEENQHDN